MKNTTQAIYPLTSHTLSQKPGISRLPGQSSNSDSQSSCRQCNRILHPDTSSEEQKRRSEVSFKKHGRTDNQHPPNHCSRTRRLLCNPLVPFILVEHTVEQSQCRTTDQSCSCRSGHEHVPPTGSENCHVGLAKKWRERAGNNGEGAKWQIIRYGT